jgi:hypothetical protein
MIILNRRERVMRKPILALLPVLTGNASCYRSTMKYSIAALVICLFFVSPALAWNNKGHMVIAKLAWDQLNQPAKVAATRILKTHPHYAEFLVADRPDNIPEDQWAFMRAATWSDWVRSHHRSQFDNPTWHCTNKPYVPQGSKLKESDFPPKSPNVVTQITEAITKVKSGTAEEKPIYFCWLLHLVGDVHQPLHCTALFSEKFPKGDRGGNLLLVRIKEGDPKKLHALWDGLFGTSTQWSSIRGTIDDIAQSEKENQVQIDADLKSATTPDDWANEGLASAKKDVYLDGKLAVANSDDRPKKEDVPNLPADYMKNAGKVARIAAAKAGHRLAQTLSTAL